MRRGKEDKNYPFLPSHPLVYFRRKFSNPSLVRCGVVRPGGNSAFPLPRSLLWRILLTLQLLVTARIEKGLPCFKALWQTQWNAYGDKTWYVTVRFMEKSLQERGRQSMVMDCLLLCHYHCRAVFWDDAEFWNSVSSVDELFSRNTCIRGLQSYNLPVLSRVSWK